MSIHTTSKCSHMKPDISVIIPNYNSQDTLATCLNSVLKSKQVNFELIVVDDGSEDDSLEIIQQFPCKIIKQKHLGASAARNAGALAAQSTTLFFTDADCVLSEDTLANALSAIRQGNHKSVIGGSYNASAYDKRFYSRFQATFIHYSETKNIDSPDYIATHLMVIDRDVFLASGGFKEHWLPILEDVDFSHRLRRMGYDLTINSSLLVQHIFNFSFSRSVHNAIRKASYWTLYSMNNNDLLKDSGTASHELKLNVVYFYLMIMCISMAIMTSQTLFFSFATILIFSLNLAANKHLLNHFSQHDDFLFHIGSMVYYLFVYPIPVSLGGMVGLSKYLHYSTTRRTI